MSLRVPDGLPFLAAGSHASPQDGACVMEYVSILAGESFDDAPQCVHQDLAGAARIVNDTVSDAMRQELLLSIPRFIGTNKLALGRMPQPVFDRWVRLVEAVADDTSLPAIHYAFVHDVDRCDACQASHREKLAQLGELLDIADAQLSRDVVIAAQEDLRRYEAERLRAAEEVGS